MAGFSVTEAGGSKILKNLEFPVFLEKIVVPERNVLEKWN